jgi:hypothetical protein
MIIENPSDWVRIILETGSAEDMVALECELLTCLNAARSEYSYNGHNGGAKYYRVGPQTGKAAKGVPNTGGKAKGVPATGKNAKGVLRGPATGGNAKGMRCGIPAKGDAAKGIPKTGKSAKGVPNTGGRAKGVLATGENAKGMPATGGNAKGVKKGPATGKNIKGKPRGPQTGKNAKGYKMSDERRSKLSKPQQIITCPHCDKSGGVSLMKRYHGDNCKFKP